jgi:hypothetical protein
MAEVTDPQNVPDPAGAPSDPVASAVDPRDTELAELRAYRDQATATFERLKPHEDYIRRIVEDDEAREFTRNAWETYDDIKAKKAKTVEPQYSAEEQRIADAIEARLKARFPDEAVEYVTAQAKQYREQQQREADERTSREKSAKENSERFVRDNSEWAQRAVDSKRLTWDEVAELGAFATALHQTSVAKGEPRFVSLEEAERTLQGRSARLASPSAAPRSLRAHAAAPGIPGNSKPPERDRSKPYKRGDVTAHMLQVLNSKGA